jgi:hypothetical protein
VAHGQEEHLQAEQLLVRLAETDPQSAKFDQVLTELVDSVTHHVEEKESTLLPGLRERLDDQCRAALGRAFAASREQHLGDRPGAASKADFFAPRSPPVGKPGCFQSPALARHCCRKWYARGACPVKALGRFPSRYG